MKYSSYIKSIFLLFLSCMFCVASLVAQEEGEKEKLSIKIDQIVADDYPNLKAYAVVQDANGDVLTGLSPTLFKFRVDLQELDVKTEITSLSLEGSPIDYTIVFSNNGIMEGEPLDFQKNAILQLIDILKPKDKLSLYTIGEEATVIFEEQLKDEIDLASINEVTVTSAQPRLHDSIINIIRKVQRRDTERKVIIVMSDGRDQNSRFTKEQLDAVLVESGIPIYAMGMRVLSTQSLSSLNEMADITDGSYIFSSTLSAIPDNLKKLNSYIVQPYVIELRVRGVPADDLPHIFEVSIDERDSSGKGEKTFIAVKVPVPFWFRVTILVVSIVALIAFIIMSIIMRIKKRRRMGIAKRRCPDCRARMKDSWDTCPFCKYLPQNTKVKTKKSKKS